MNFVKSEFQVLNRRQNGMRYRQTKNGYLVKGVQFPFGIELAVHKNRYGWISTIVGTGMTGGSIAQKTREDAINQTLERLNHHGEKKVKRLLKSAMELFNSSPLEDSEDEEDCD